jgi:hypothetical protein
MSDQFDSIELNEQLFSKKALELIHTLPIQYPEEDKLAIFKFIQFSVNFWRQVIPPLQDQEPKYPLEALEEGSNYFANIIISEGCNSFKKDQILQHPRFTEESISQDQQFPALSQKQSDEIKPKLFSDETIPGKSFQNSDAKQKLLNTQNSNPIDESIISLISECFQLIYPQKKENMSHLEQLNIIHNYLAKILDSSNDGSNNFMVYYLEILSFFESSTPIGNVTTHQLLKLIFQSSKSTYDKVHFLSQLLVGYHPQMSTLTELDQLLKYLCDEIFIKFSRSNDKLQNRYFSSKKTTPLNTILFKVFDDLSLTNKNYLNLINTISPLPDSSEMSFLEIMNKTTEPIQELEFRLETMVQVMKNKPSKKKYWLNYVRKMHKEVELIQKIIAKNPNLQNKSLSKIIKTQLHDIKNLSERPNISVKSGRLKEVSTQILNLISPKIMKKQHSKNTISDYLYHSFNYLFSQLDSITSLLNSEQQKQQCILDICSLIRKIVSQIQNKIATLILRFSPSNSAPNISQPLSILIDILENQINVFSSNFYSVLECVGSFESQPLLDCVPVLARYINEKATKKKRRQSN